MAKSKMSPAADSLFIAQSPGAQDTPRPKATKKTPKNGKEPKAGMTAGPAFPKVQQYSEPKERTPDEMLKEDVQHEKRWATRDWVAGRISTSKHNQVHSRAKQVLQGMKRGH